jgi:L-lactate dehydrogenase (cytochrome)
MKLGQCHNIHDLRRLAQKKLPAPMFHYIDGGADDEWTLRRNTDAFDDYQLQPSYLRNIQHIDLTTNVLGTTLDLPFFLAPTGMSRLFHHEKELGVARAAAKFGALYSLSTVGTTSLEDIAAIPGLKRMFQIYILKDRELTREFVQRCKGAGYEAMCLTVDTPLAGNRERDLVHGMTMPPKFGLKSLWSFATHFEWAWHVIRQRDFKLANVVTPSARAPAWWNT